MTSEKQIRANRENAKRSTGPKTPNGKQMSSKNAIKHGVLSKEIVLPDEDVGQFEELITGLYNHFQPEGQLEVELVDRLAADFWRGRRLHRIEASVLSARINEVKERLRLQRKSASAESDPKNPKSQTNEGAGERNEGETDEREVIGMAFGDDLFDCKILALLPRYDTNIAKSISRLIHELERQQALRKGANVTLPIVGDLDIHLGD